MYRQEDSPCWNKFFKPLCCQRRKPTSFQPGGSFIWSNKALACWMKFKFPALRESKWNLWGDRRATGSGQNPSPGLPTLPPLHVLPPLRNTGARHIRQRRNYTPWETVRKIGAARIFVPIYGPAWQFFLPRSRPCLSCLQCILCVCVLHEKRTN